MIRLTNMDNILALEEYYVTSIMEMEGSKSSMPNMIISKKTDRESEGSDENLESMNWEWRCYEQFFREGRWVRMEVGAKDENVGVRPPFDVVTIVHPNGSQSEAKLIVHSPHLVRILRDHCPPNTGAVFSEGCRIHPNELFFRRPALQNYLSEHDAQLSASVWHARHLLRFVERHFARTLVEYDRMQAEKCVSFEMLWAFFAPGTKVCRRCLVTNQECFATVKLPAAIVREEDGPKCYVELNVMDFNVSSYYKCTQTYTIPSFEGEVPFTSLQVCPLHFFPNHENMEARFLSVGKIFYKTAMREPFSFMEFKGSINFFSREGGCWALHKLNADGRVMIDLLSFARMNPVYPLDNAQPPCEVMAGMWTPAAPGKMKKPSDEKGKELLKMKKPSDEKRKIKMKKPSDKDSSDEDSDEEFEKPSDKDGDEEFEKPSDEDSDEEFDKEFNEALKLAPAFAYGFSFRLKKWGCFEICGLRKIVFNEGASEALQLREDSQKEVLWNVANQFVGGSARMQNDLDPIAHKGAGCIVLCHGPPGTGKTLTAEVMAETLKCPLWSISTSELGNEPDEVEMVLTQITEVADTWHAILLLDEADVYLEKRDEGTDVKRNRLTSVFLRMLEYYCGIMFLTTNRVSAFDDAVLSRTTLAISYPALNDTQRRSIWMRLLTRAGIHDATDDVHFSHYNLNGRQIRNVIHLAQLLAQGQEQQCEITHVRKALDAFTAGTNELLPTPPPS